MIERRPAVDFIDAVDGPIEVLRRNIGTWAPTMAILITVSVLPNIPAQFAARSFMEDVAAGNLRWELMPVMYLPLLIGLPLAFILGAAEFHCVSNAMNGRPTGVLDVLRPCFRLKFLLAYFVYMVFACTGVMTCCFGGFLLFVPLGLVVAAATEEGLGADAIRRSVDLGLMRTGPNVLDRPGWKIVALMLSSYLLTVAGASAGQIPVLGSFAWEAYDAVTSGDPSRIATLGTVNPWASTVGILLTAGVRVFTDALFAAGTILIFRDAVLRQDAADLERAIG